MTKFSHFILKKNFILERFKSNSRRQLPGEAIEAYITSLYYLVESCSYENVNQNEDIRGRIVQGMLNKNKRK